MASTSRIARIGDAAPGDAAIAARVRELMEALGLDLGDPHLEGTPGRVAGALRELLGGLTGDEPRLSTFPNAEGYRGMVVVSGVRFHSLCAHHFLPFLGEAHLAYVPGERLVGLSKLARVVEFFARRPQVQERLTEQVADLLDERLRPAGVIALLRARHLCVEMRGVRKSGWTVTTAARGVFEEPAWREEFLSQLGAAGRLRREARDGCARRVGRRETAHPRR